MYLLDINIENISFNLQRILKNWNYQKTDVI